MKGTLRALLGLMLLAGLPITSAAQAFDTLIVSDAGDFVGAGEQYHLQAVANEVTEVADGSGVRIQWQYQTVNWMFKFAGPGGVQLHIGAYEDAQRQDTTFQQPGHPGMDISGLGRGCNTLTGRFDVRDVAYDGSGALLRLAVDATQYCEGSARALHVYLRYGGTAVPVIVAGTRARAGADKLVLPAAAVSLDGTQSVAEDGGALAYAWTQVSGTPVQLNGALGATPTFIAPTPSREWTVLTFQLEVTDSQGQKAQDRVDVIVSENSQPRSEIRVVSQKFEPVGQGQVLDEVVDPARLTLGRNFYNGIDLKYAFTGTTAPGLQLKIAAPVFQELHVEHQELAYRYPFFSPSGKAGLDAILVLGCNESVSRYVVHDVAYDDSGAVQRLAMDFVEICLDEGNTLPFYGFIRVNSVVPITSRAPAASAGADILAEPGQSISLDAGASNGGASAVTSYMWKQVSGPTVTLANPAAASTAFVAPAVPAGGAILEFEVAVQNAAGFTDRDSVLVHVQGSGEPRFYISIAPSGYDFVSLGYASFFDGNTGAFRISRTSDGGFGREAVDVSFSDISSWDVTLLAAQGELLAPGVYPDLSTTTPDHAGLRFSGDGRGCNSTVGSMTIHEIKRDADGNVTGLAMEFLTRCDGGAPTYGIVRYNSTVPAVAPTLLASAGPSQGANGGDRVTLSADLTYVGATGVSSYSWRQVGGPPVTLVGDDAVRATFTAPAAGGVLQFEVTVTSQDGQVDTSLVTVNVQPAGTTRTMLALDSDPGMTLSFGQSLAVWDNVQSRVMDIPPNSVRVQVDGGYAADLQLWAPFDQPLLQNVWYEGARQFNGEHLHRALSFPGMEFEFDSFYCKLSRGRFLIRELVRDTSGQVSRLAVDFQQTCDPTGQYVRGALRANSAIPVGDSLPLAAAGPDLTVRNGEAVDIDGRASTAGPTEQATYHWQQVSGPALILGTPDAPLLHVTTPALSAGTADAVLALTVTDSHGFSATDAMTVHVLGDDAPGTQIVASRFLADGTKVAAYKYNSNDTYVQMNTADPNMFGLVFIEPTDLYAGFHVEAPAHLATGTYRAEEPYRFEFHKLSDNCADAPGAVRILEARYDTDKVAALAFDFDVLCGTDHYVGVVRVNSAKPLQLGSGAAEAGADVTVDEGGSVVLDGRRSLIVGAPIGSYRWTQLSGPTVTLAETATGVVEFTAPSVSATSTLQFKVEVFPIAGTTTTQSASDVVNVTVTKKAPPVQDPPPGSGGTGNGGGSSGSGGGGAVDGPMLLLLLLTLGRKSLREHYRRTGHRVEH